MDRRIVMTSMTSSHSDDWQPLINYRNSLLHGESDQAAPVIVTKKVYGRKGKKSQGIEDEVDDA